MDTTYYQLLGVPPTADQPTIKQAFRHLVRTHHPDLRAGDARAADLTRQVIAAYATLSSPMARKKYDEVLAGQHSDQPSANAATMPAGTRTGSWIDPYSGYDVTYTITISAAEAAAGVSCVLTFHTSQGYPYDVVISIPPLSRTWDSIRLAGAGGPAQNGRARGDLYVVVTVL